MLKKKKENVLHMIEFHFQADDISEQFYSSIFVKYSAYFDSYFCSHFDGQK